MSRSQHAKLWTIREAHHVEKVEHPNLKYRRVRADAEVQQ